ncbi:MAG TPA: hypothetical protein ENI44_03345, partial [Thermoplasmatales archaeon]|nr:hypothetical protein [Thermoplasmatales archaeon]
MYTSLFRKILVLGIIFLFAGAGTIPSVNGESWKIKTTYGEIPRASSADFGTIIVDDEGDGDYTSIQNAIENAQNGDTIKVYSGTYTENVLIDKQLTIMGVDEELGKGDDTGKPIIDGGGKGDVVIINRDASNVNFSGFMVINGGDNNKNWDSAIKIFSNNNIIYNNNISFNNLLGITLYSSSGNIISNNDFYLNEAGGLVLSINSPNNTIICNNFNKDGLLFTTWGEDIENKLSYWNSQTIEDNLVNGKPLYYYKNE